ncbi:hypothetical protein [Actinoplanes sp. NPDC051851]|uniref:hypothetical protein n=1 Tax=Actinoplanes sp. NPDC051851 TaxID=3154753 RepID=UPI00343177F4
MTQPPYSGPPYPGQPNPDVPSSVPPQPGPAPTPPYGYGPQQDYPPPGYQQPGYQQPGYQQPGYPAPPGYPPQPGYPPPAPPKSRTGPIIALSVAIVLVLCLGGAASAVLLVRNANQTTTGADAPVAGGTGTETTEPTGEATTEPAEDAGEDADITVAAPQKLNGRPKIDEDEAASLASLLKQSLGSLPGVTNSVGAVYGNSSRSNLVTIAAAEAPIDDPDSYLGMLFYALGSGDSKVTDTTEVSTGSLGGAAKCGNTESDGIRMALCGWADEGSLGMVVWYFKSADKVTSEFPTIRSQIETRG